ncbi:hypothetical protein DOT_4660 [Desulfosporosinus sp. OT]|nr:hypothetical protein DOT_4660 [Desulfosporosinus sp. OT]
MGSAEIPSILEEPRQAGTNPERIAKKGSERNVTTQAGMLVTPLKAIRIRERSMATASLGGAP